jgi:hypothetical protein
MRGFTNLYFGGMRKIIYATGDIFRGLINNLLIPAVPLKRAEDERKGVVRKVGLIKLFLQVFGG